MDIGNRDFSRLYEQYKPGTLGWGSGEHLRGKEDLYGGTQIYLHGTWSFSNGGDVAAKERAAKFETGALEVKRLLGNQIGHDLAAVVFRKVFDETGRNLDKEVTRGDLERIRTAVDSLTGKEDVVETTGKGGKVEVRDRSGLGGFAPSKPRLTENQQLLDEVFGVPKGREPGKVDRTTYPLGEKILTELFGRKLTDEEIRGLGGLPETASVTLTPVQIDGRIQRNPDGKVGVMIHMTGKDALGGFKQVEATVYRDTSGRLLIYRDNSKAAFELTDERPPPEGLGANMLVKQVNAARGLGVSEIHNFASQGPRYNGYYTWARYGGNAPLNETTAGRLEDRSGYDRFMKALGQQTAPPLSDLAGKKDLEVQDLMASPEGREFWRKNGFGIPMTFELDKGSKTMQAFRDYTVPKASITLN